MAREKLDRFIKVNLPESMIHDVQDEAMKEDMSASEYVRYVLSLYMYGSIGVSERRRQGISRAEETR